MPEVAENAREGILRKIRAMMDRAKDPNAPEGEVEAALSMVRKFMDEHDVSEGDLGSPKGVETAWDQMTHGPSMNHRPRCAVTDRNVAQAVAIITDTSAYLDSLRDGSQNMCFFGMARDVAVAKYLYMELITTMRAMARLKMRGRSSREIAAYAVGFGDRLNLRARELKREREAVGSQVGAIVLIKKDLLRRYANEKLALKAGKSRRTSYGGVSGYGQGFADGANVSLGTNGIGGGNGQQGRLK